MTQEPGSVTQSSLLGWFGKRRGRKLREAITAYLFLLPALIIIGTFGLFPLAFSAYESTLKGLNTFLGKYGGMDNYTKAIAELAYVLAFLIAAVFFFWPSVLWRVPCRCLARTRKDCGLGVCRG